MNRQTAEIIALKITEELAAKWHDLAIGEAGFETKTSIFFIVFAVLLEGVEVLD